MSRSDIPTSPTVAAAARATVAGCPRQRFCGAARGADDVDKGRDFLLAQAPWLPPRSAPPRSGVASGGRRAEGAACLPRRLGRGGGAELAAAAAAALSALRVSRATSAFLELGRPRVQRDSSAACERPPGTGPGVAGWADIPAVGPSGLLGPNAWASRAEWVAVVGTVPASPGGERGRGPWASCREHL